MKLYSNAVVIGRFQPFHVSHLKLIKAAIDYADNVIVIIGSANQPRNIKNPFTYSERAQMIQSSVKEMYGTEASNALRFSELTDNMYDDDAWSADLRKAVDRSSITNTKGTLLIGCNKDSSSYYLNMFPEWKLCQVPQTDILSATEVRSHLFEGNCRKFEDLGFILESVLPIGTRNFLKYFIKSPAYKILCDEYDFIKKYKEQFASLPYAPTFVTTDAVVVCSGHVLMVKRGANPGKGQWALPGGFLDAATDKSLLDCAIRELIEETKIDLTPNILKSRVEGFHVFDSIDRSLRGRTITHAFYFNLRDGKLPKVKGSDDAVDAKWIRLVDLDRQYIYEDHYDIIRKNYKI